MLSLPDRVSTRAATTSDPCMDPAGCVCLCLLHLNSCLEGPYSQLICFACVGRPCLIALHLALLPSSSALVPPSPFRCSFPDCFSRSKQKDKKPPFCCPVLFPFVPSLLRSTSPNTHHSPFWQLPHTIVHSFFSLSLSLSLSPSLVSFLPNFISLFAHLSLAFSASVYSQF